MSVWRVTFKELSDRAGFVDVLIDAYDADDAEYAARGLLCSGIHFELVGRPLEHAEQQLERELRRSVAPVVPLPDRRRPGYRPHQVGPTLPAIRGAIDGECDAYQQSASRVFGWPRGPHGALSSATAAALRVLACESILETAGHG